MQEEGTFDPYNPLLVEERPLVQDGEKFALRFVQSAIAGLYVGFTKKAVLHSEVLTILKENRIKIFLFFFLN